MSIVADQGEFKFEYDEEQRRRLRIRVQWYAAVTIVLTLIGLAISLASRASAEDARNSVELRWVFMFSFAASSLSIFAYGWVFFDALRSNRSRQDQLRVLRWLLVFTTVTSTVLSFVTAYLLIEPLGGVRIAPSSASGSLRGMYLWQQAAVFAASQIGATFFTHFVACLFLPWTPRESLRPMFPMLAVTAGCLIGLAALAAQNVRETLIAVGVALGIVVMCGAVMLPGLAVAWWKNNRFAREFFIAQMGSRYGEMRRELSGAQRIHESMFPKAETRAGIRLDYRYVPMRAIGGDYLYARYVGNDQGEASLIVVLLDVTGHGIPAALTVNRLHGELERQVAERPDIQPTELLRALNRYAFLTLSDHSLFVTAAVFRVDAPTTTRPGVLHYANGGHPPAVVRKADGSSVSLEPTAMVLGVTKELDVEVEDACTPFGVGDVMVAYTDGAMEARDTHGRMLNVEGVQGLVTTAPIPCSNLCDKLMGAIAAHRFGPATDDTLIVEVACLAANETVIRHGASSRNGDTRYGARVVGV